MKPIASVLLVDDDPSVRTSVARALESEGLAVRTAADGEAAAELFFADEPDIVLLDLTMPGRSGWDVYELLSTRAPWVPFVIITARHAQMFSACAAGVAALVEKPVDIAVLVATIRKVLDDRDIKRIGRLATRYHSASDVPPIFVGSNTRVGEV